MEKVIEIHSKWPGPGLSRETPPKGGARLHSPSPTPLPPTPPPDSHHQRRPQARVLRPGFQGECDEPVTLLSPPLTSRLPATTVSPALLCGVGELRFRGVRSLLQALRRQAQTHTEACVLGSGLCPWTSEPHSISSEHPWPRDQPCPSRGPAQEAAHSRGLLPRPHPGSAGWPSHECPCPWVGPRVSLLCTELLASRMRGPWPRSPQEAACTTPHHLGAPAGGPEVPVPAAPP